jgi:hypothetical protein
MVTLRMLIDLSGCGLRIITLLTNISAVCNMIVPVVPLREKELSLSSNSSISVVYRGSWDEFEVLKEKDSKKPNSHVLTHS